MYEKTTSTLKALFFTLKKTTKQETDRQTHQKKGGEKVSTNQKKDCNFTIVYKQLYYIIIGNIYEEK